MQPEEAVISCTWREVLGAFKDFNLTPGKKVIVVGSGPVGLSFVKLGKLFGLGQIDIVDSFLPNWKLPAVWEPTMDIHLPKSAHRNL